jgi:hypothetical protein
MVDKISLVARVRSISFWSFLYANGVLISINKGYQIAAVVVIS